MTLWFVFALMTAAAIFAVLWPLGRGSRPRSDASEAVVYKDQLAEIDRDLAAGLIGAPEAEAARVEIGRRLLAAADHRREPPTASSIRLRRSAALIALVGLPIAVGGVLSAAGIAAARRFSAGGTHPRARRQPAARQSGRAGPGASGEKSDRWPRLERAGAGAGAARPLRRGGRAYHNSITYNGDSAERRADLGEAMAGAAGGVVTSEAKAEFERAVALDADDVKARYFLGLAAEQDGRGTDAAVDLARHAGKSAAGCAVASAGSGGAGPGRRLCRAGVA